MSLHPTRVPAPRKIAAKFLGGFVPAVAYHFGVLEILEERGFALRRGFRDRDEPRETGPPGIDLVVGSSAGAFFVVAACAGASREELIGAVADPDVAPFRGEDLGRGDGLTVKVLKWLRDGPRASWSGRRTWKSWAAENTLNVLFPLWRLDAIERYLREEVLRERDWPDLRTEAAILAVDLDHPVTYIAGEQESPVLALLRREPVSPEAVHTVLGSKGKRVVAAFEAAGVDPDHEALAPYRVHPELRRSAVYVRGIPMECAAAGSMATYPFYEPVPFAYRDGTPYRIGHYPVTVIDGEDRNPFTTDVAEEAGSDLVIVSSISAPYRYLHGLGSLSGRGYSDLHQQKTAHGRDAKQEDVVRAHTEQRHLFRAARSILVEHGCPREAIERLEEEFHRVVWINNLRIRISPDPDVAAENRILQELDPLAFDPEGVQRAVDLGRMVARRVLRDYVFEFLD
ncbi:MAG: hypothetical protein R3199_00100 [Gemmatimonadota bacterium]|nr:hypothetical protein [Gemmatimonadota bacterium]